MQGVRRIVLGLAVLLTLCVATHAQSGESDLRIYFADVEGGQATLFVSPTESLLVDTGWPGFDGRDADRIMALCKMAGVAKIDNLLITHYHVDHVGGLPQLVAKIPVSRFIDHGVNRELEPTSGWKQTADGYNAYQKVLEESHAAHLVVKPGDVLPLKSMHVDVVSADGEVLAKALPGAGGAGRANAACAASPVKDAEDTENDRSVGILITFGKLRILDLGDLTWAKERPLMCPTDKLGKVDVYIISHHGLDRSGSPALVNAIAPRVAVMGNGGRKGGAPATFDALAGTSRLKDVWQLHTVQGNDAKHNMADSRIANLPGPDAGNYLELDGKPDGSFAVTNGRTGETVQYSAP